MPKTDMPCILDREINDKVKDAFGHIDFAMALKSIIESKKNIPPYSIGLLGPWGTGKSSIKSLYLQDLEDDTSKINGIKRRDRLKPITFNAWKYGNNDGKKSIKKSLLRHVYLELDGKEKDYDDIVNNITKSSYKTERPWNQIFKDFLQDFFWNPVFYVAQIIVCTFVGYFITLTVSHLTGKDLTEGYTLLTILTANIIPILAGFARKENFGIKRYTDNYSFHLPKKSAEDYEATLFNQIRIFKAKNKNFEKIIIFIDDLDRLSPIEMVDGIDAVRTFMEIPNKELGIIFIISCAENRIAQALQKRQMNNGMPGAVKTIDDARRYLDRIFQFRLEIPPLPKQDMRDYAIEKLKEDAPSVLDEIIEKGGRPVEIVDCMIHTDVTTPRKTLQIVNAFVQSWWIAKKREFRGSGSESHGGLSENTITAHPKTLAILSSLKISFPDFYLALLEDNELIKKFSNIFIHKNKEINEFTPKTQSLISRFCEEKSEDKSELKFECYNLQRFISSIDGHIWPNSIQPFLQLSQDVISRKYGDSASRILDNLMDGDSNAILTELGKSHDKINLTSEDVSIITNLFEETDNETPRRQENAVSAIAKLSIKTEGNDKTKLLHPICHKIISSHNLRARIGITNLVNIIDEINKDYRKEITECLITDAFSDNKNFGLKLSSLELPSLDESSEMAITLIDKALNVWQNDGLSNPCIEILTSWLLTREINIKDQGRTIPFIKLQNWANLYPELLVSSLSHSLVEQLLSERLEKAKLKEDLTNEINLCESVFNNLYAKGGSYLKKMWELLTKTVQIKAESACVFAWTYATPHTKNTNLKDIEEFCNALSERLLKDFTDEKEWGIEDWSDGAKTLNKLLINTPELLNSETLVAGDLLEKYATHKDCCYYTIDLLDKAPLESPLYKRVVNFICDNFSKNNTSEIITWIAKNYKVNLNTENRNYIITTINNIISKPSIDENEQIDLNEFFTNINNNLNLKEINLIFETLFNHLHLNFNTSSYLFYENNISKIITSIIPLFKRSDSETSALLFMNTFNVLINHEQYFYKLHEFMDGNWPTKMKGINFNQIVQVSINFLGQHNPNEKWKYIFETLNQLVFKIESLANFIPQVKNIAYQHWIHSPEICTEIIKNPQNTVEHLDTLISFNYANFKDKIHSSLLPQVWEKIFAHKAENELLTESIAMLRIPKKGTKETPDLALNLWLNAVPNTRIDQLSTKLAESTDLDDENKLRLVSQLIQYINIDKETILRIIESSFADELPKTQNEIFRLKNKITSYFTSNEDNRILNETLLRILIANTSVDRKKKLATWMSAIDGGPTLNILKDGEIDFSEDDLAILGEEFKLKKKLFKELNELLEKNSESDT